MGSAYFRGVLPSRSRPFVPSAPSVSSLFRGRPRHTSGCARACLCVCVCVCKMKRERESAAVCSCTSRSVHMISGRYRYRYRHLLFSPCRRCPPRRGHVCVTARLLPNVRCKFPLSCLTRSAPTFRRIPAQREREREERQKDIARVGGREQAIGRQRKQRASESGREESEGGRNGGRTLV